MSFLEAPQCFSFGLQIFQIFYGFQERNLDLLKWFSILRLLAFCPEWHEMTEMWDVKDKAKLKALQ